MFEESVIKQPQLSLPVLKLTGNPVTLSDKGKFCPNPCSQNCAPACTSSCCFLLPIVMSSLNPHAKPAKKITEVSHGQSVSLSCRNPLCLHKCTPYCPASCCPQKPKVPPKISRPPISNVHEKLAPAIKPLKHLPPKPSPQVSKIISTQCPSDDSTEGCTGTFIIPLPSTMYFDEKAGGAGLGFPEITIPLGAVKPKAPPALKPIEHLQQPAPSVQSPHSDHAVVQPAHPAPQVVPLAHPAPVAPPSHPAPQVEQTFPSPQAPPHFPLSTPASPPVMATAEAVQPALPQPQPHVLQPQAPTQLVQPSPTESAFTGELVEPSSSLNAIINCNHGCPQTCGPICSPDCCGTPETGVQSTMQPTMLPTHMIFSPLPTLVVVSPPVYVPTAPDGSPHQDDLPVYVLPSDTPAIYPTTYSPTSD